MHQWTFHNLVIAGGAMKSFSAVGCIKYLEETKLRHQIHNFLGTSAGSIICLFLVLGYTTQEIYDFVTSYFAEHIDEPAFNIEDMLSILDTFGINKGDYLYSFAKSMLQKKLGIEDITFLDLAKQTGKNLIVCVANLSKQREEYWNVDNCPNMSVIKAIRASCAIPILFTPIRHNGDIYVDGGIYNNFPMNYFSNESYVLKDIIGINISSVIPKDNKDMDFLDYATLVFHTILNKVTNTHQYQTDAVHNVVTLNVDEVAWMDVNRLRIYLPETVIQQYIDTGYQKMKSMLSVKKEDVTLQNQPIV
jgi:predicted acylesterase/phospholipase RssA